MFRAGIAYELQRISARKGCPRIIKWLVIPGLWMQKLTTREPGREQLEIACLALSRGAGPRGGPLAKDGVKLSVISKAPPPSPDRRWLRLWDRPVCRACGG